MMSPKPFRHNSRTRPFATLATSLAKAWFQKMAAATERFEGAVNSMTGCWVWSFEERSN